MLSCCEHSTLYWTIWWGFHNYEVQEFCNNIDASASIGLVRKTYRGPTNPGIKKTEVFIPLNCASNGFKKNFCTIELFIILLITIVLL